MDQHVRGCGHTSVRQYRAGRSLGLVQEDVGRRASPDSGGHLPTAIVIDKDRGLAKRKRPARQRDLKVGPEVDSAGNETLNRPAYWRFALKRTEIKVRLGPV